MSDRVPMHIRLSDERRAELVERLQRFVDEAFELSLSEFQAKRLLDFLVAELGPPVYNQAIQDARGFLEERLADLEGEFYEPEAGSR